MKHRILVCLTLVLLLTLGLSSAAMAANIPEVNVVLSTDRFSGPGEVAVTIRVTNTADTDMPGPMALYDPTGARIVEFGTPTLSAGASKSWEGVWAVTDKQLDAGRIDFVLAYTVDEGGVLITKNQPVYVSISRVGAEPAIEVRRTITPTVAKQGQKVYVIYEISNTGGVDVANVTITENSAISSKKITIPLIRVGEKATHTFTVEMGKKNLTSKATVTFEANGEKGTREVEKATIKYGNVRLDATLKADKKGGNIGDVVTLTLTLKNTGKADVENISVTDPVLGAVFSGLSVPANSEITETKELTITQSGDFLFTVSGANKSGDIIETSTGIVSIIAVDPAKAVNLSVAAEADKTTVYMLPGIVKFTVHVTNDSSVTAENVDVVSSGVTLYSFKSIAPGQTVSFVRDVRVDMAGRYRFDAVVADQLGQDVTFNGNEVQISYSAPTATPSMAPIATPVAPRLESLPQSDGLPSYVGTVQNALNIGFWVALVLSALFLALIVVGVVGRSARAAKSSNAADHLERDGYSDYTQAVPARHRRLLPDAEEEDEEAEEVARPVGEDVAPADVPEEPADASSMQAAINEMYPEAVVEEESASVAEQPVDPSEETTYRRRRVTEEE